MPSPSKAESHTRESAEGTLNVTEQQGNTCSCHGVGQDTLLLSRYDPSRVSDKVFSSLSVRCLLASTTCTCNGAAKENKQPMPVDRSSSTAGGIRNVADPPGHISSPSSSLYTLNSHEERLKRLMQKMMRDVREEHFPGSFAIENEQENINAMQIKRKEEEEETLREQQSILIGEREQRLLDSSASSKLRSALSSTSGKGRLGGRSSSSRGKKRVQISLDSATARTSTTEERGGVESWITRVHPLKGAASEENQEDARARVSRSSSSLTQNRPAENERNGFEDEETDELNMSKYAREWAAERRAMDAEKAEENEVAEAAGRGNGSCGLLYPSYNSPALSTSWTKSVLEDPVMYTEFLTRQGKSSRQITEVQRLTAGNAVSATLMEGVPVVPTVQRAKEKEEGERRKALYNPRQYDGAAAEAKATVGNNSNILCCEESRKRTKPATDLLPKMSSPTRFISLLQENKLDFCRDSASGSDKEVDLLFRVSESSSVVPATAVKAHHLPVHMRPTYVSNASFLANQSPLLFEKSENRSEMGALEKSEGRAVSAKAELKPTIEDDVVSNAIHEPATAVTAVSAEKGTTTAPLLLSNRKLPPISPFTTVLGKHTMGRRFTPVCETDQRDHRLQQYTLKELEEFEHGHRFMPEGPIVDDWRRPSDTSLSVFEARRTAAMEAARHGNTNGGRTRSIAAIGRNGAGGSSRIASSSPFEGSMFPTLFEVLQAELNALEEEDRNAEENARREALEAQTAADKINQMKENIAVLETAITSSRSAVEVAAMEVELLNAREWEKELVNEALQRPSGPVRLRDEKPLALRSGQTQPEEHQSHQHFVDLTSPKVMESLPPGSALIKARELVVKSPNEKTRAAARRRELEMMADALKLSKGE